MFWRTCFYSFVLLTAIASVASAQTAPGDFDRGSKSGGPGFMKFLKKNTDPDQARQLDEALGVRPRPTQGARKWRLKDPVVAPECRPFEIKWGGEANDLNEASVRASATAEGGEITGRSIQRDYPSRELLFKDSATLTVSGLKGEIEISDNGRDDPIPAGISILTEVHYKADEGTGGAGAAYAFEFTVSGFTTKPALRPLAVSRARLAVGGADGESFGLLVPRAAQGELTFTAALQGRPCWMKWVWEPVRTATPSEVAADQAPKDEPAAAETVGFCLKKFQGLELHSADKPKCSDNHDAQLREPDFCSAACTYRDPAVATPVYAATVKWRQQPTWKLDYWYLPHLTDRSEYFRPLRRVVFKQFCTTLPADGNTINSADREALAFYGGSGDREKALVLARRLLHEAEKDAAVCPRPGDEAPKPIGMILEEARERGIAGWITGLIGDVRVIRIDGTSAPATAGMKIYQWERVVTGKEARARLELTDVSSRSRMPDGGGYMPFGSSLYVGPDSDVTVRAIEPCFEDAGMDRKNPSSYCHPSTTWELIRGKIRVFMRGWGGLGAINVRAGTTVCGIRGTEFILAHDPARQQIDLSLLEGKVELSTPAQSQMVAPGQSVTVTGEKIGAPSPLDRSVWDRQVAEVAQGLGEPASGSDAQIAQGPPAEGTTTKEGKEAAKPSSEPQPDASASPATPAGTAAKPSPEPTPPSSAQDATPLPSEDLRGLTPEQAVKRLAFEALQARNRSEATLLRTMDVTEGRPTTVWPAEVREQVLKLVKDAIDDLHTALEKLKAITRDYPETADAKTLLSGGEVAGLSIAMIEKNIQSTQSELLEPMASNEATIFPRADGDIAYLKLTTFDEQTHASLIKEIEAAKRSSIGAYIIDLRDNAGGAFDPAVAVADAFLDKGTIVQTKASDSDKLERIDATPGDITEGKKLVVLINGRTAAGAEVVAAALQDHKRATIIGTRSLGGGSSERARYVAPSNRAIEIGIDPDINVEQDPKDPAQDKQLDSARAFLGGGAAKPPATLTPPSAAEKSTPRPSEDLKGLTPQQAANRLAVEARQAWNRTDVLYEQREKKFTSGSPATWSPEIREEVRALSQEIIREGRAALEKLNAIIRDYPETDHAVTLIGGGEVAGLSIARVETDLGEFERGWLQTEDELRRLEQEGAKEQPAPPSAPKESNLPASISQTTAALRERTYQAVVQITSTKAVAAQPPSASSGTAQPGNIPGPIPGLPEDHPLNEFFKHLPKKPQGESPPADTAKPQQTTASGFLVDASGLVVTTNHVVDQAQKLTAELHDGTKYEVEMVGADPRLDIALLQIKNAPGSFAVLSFGDSEKVKPGDWVAAMGSPFGLKGSITSGLVSATDRALEGRPYGLIQTDAQITNGYSGGPLLNSNGEVIGVIAALLAPSGSPATVNFAVPSNLAAQAIAQLKQYGEVRRGWLGVTIQAVSDEIAQSLGVKDRRGALVSEFSPGSPAALSELKPGDLIREVDGKPTKDARHLARQIAELQAGRSVRLKVLRNGGEREIEVTLGQFPDRSPSERPDTAASEVGLGSLLLAPLNEALRAKYSIKGSVGGVVITGVADGSEAASKGLKPGLIVRRATGAMVRSLADLTAQLDEVKRLGRPSILVLVEEATGKSWFVAIPLADLEGAYRGKRADLTTRPADRMWREARSSHGARLVPVNFVEDAPRALGRSALRLAQTSPTEGTTAPATSTGEAPKPSESQEQAAPAGATPSTGAAEPSPAPLPDAAQEATPRPSEDLKGLTPQQAANRLAVEARQAYNRAERRFLQSQEELQAWVLPPPHAAHEALFGMWKNQPEVRQKLRDAMEEVIRQGRTALEKLQAIIRDYPETDHAVTLIGGGEVAGLSIASLEEGLSEHEAQRKLVLEEMQRLDQGAAPRSQDAAKQGAPSAAATEDLQALDGKLQKMLNWRVVKREFPDWYSERLNEAARLSANNQPKLAITKHLAEALVGLRRQHANAALAASTERLKDVASAFLNNLKSLSARSVASCHGFISQGETAPAVLELLLSPEQGASLHVQLAATFEAIADGRKASVMRTRATNADYDLLRQELTKLGWKQADFQIFSEPSALAGQQPDRICSMMQDWIAAHLSVEDGAVQERLLVEVLKPLVSG